MGWINREFRVECREILEYFGFMKTEFAPLFKLGRAERLQLVEDLWDSIAQEDSSLPVPDWKQDELRRRKEHYLKNPSTGRTWEQVKQRARAQHD